MSCQRKLASRRQKDWIAVPKGSLRDFRRNDNVGIRSICAFLLTRPKVTPDGGGRKLKYYVYILASRRNGTLYVGMTNNLRSRIAQHKSAAIPGFTQKYDVKMLVYFEEFNDPRDAIAREKQLKWWRRKWKLQLIESVNPEWKDIAVEL